MIIYFKKGLAIFFILLLLLPTSIMAANEGVVVTGGESLASISLDTCITAASADWTLLSDLAITEQGFGDIGIGEHIFSLPPGWIFNTSAIVNVNDTLASDLVLASTTATLTATTISFFVESPSSLSKARLVVSNLQIQPDFCNYTSETFSLIYNGPASIYGIAGARLGNFSVMPGQNHEIKFVEFNDRFSADSGVTVKVANIDQFGNETNRDEQLIDFTIFSDENCLDAIGSSSMSTINGVAILNYPRHEVGTFSIGASSASSTLCTGRLSVDLGQLYLVDLVHPLGGNRADQPFAVQPTIGYQDLWGNKGPDGILIEAQTNNTSGVLRNVQATTSGGQAIFNDLGFSKSNEALTIYFVSSDGLYSTSTFDLSPMTPGLKDHLEWLSAPETVVEAGKPISFSIAINDIYHNLIEQPESIGVISSSSLQGSLLKASDNGFVSFTDLATTTTGDISFAVVSGNLAPLYSGNITITPTDLGTLVVSGVATSTVAGEKISMQVVAYDGYNNLKTNYVGTLNFAHEAGPAYTFQLSDNGQHVFNDYFSLTQTAVTDFGFTAEPEIFEYSQPIFIRPGVARQFNITPLAGDSPCDQPWLTAPTVELLDEFGNQVIDGTMVEVRLINGKGVLRGATTTTLNGIATFNDLGYSKSGEDFTEIAFVADGRSSEVVTLPTLTNGAVKSFAVLDLVAGLKPGQATTFRLEARDQYGNIARDYTGMVSFSTTNSDDSTLPLDYEFTAADEGIHVFENLKFKSSGMKSFNVYDADGIGGSLNNYLIMDPGGATPSWLLTSEVKYPVQASVKPILKEQTGKVEKGLTQEVKKKVLGFKIYKPNSLLRTANGRIYEIRGNGKIFHIKTLNELFKRPRQVIYKLNQTEFENYNLIN
ncbi:MAG: hypothetical protein WCG01_05540 [bacterium]